MARGVVYGVADRWSKTGDADFADATAADRVEIQMEEISSMLSVNSYPLTWRALRRRSGSARLELRQNFLADFFEVLGGVALAILEVEDDVVHTGRV